MPPRKARASVAQSTKPISSKKSRKRQLDAFAIAGKIAPEKSTVSRHRLGEVENDQPRKRSRVGEDEDEEEEDPAESRQEKRRRKNDDDNVEYGSDSEGNEWTIGAVADDDDESLDSDEAFGESDEERFESFTFRGSSGSKTKARPKPAASSSRSAEIDLDEDLDGASEDEEEDDFGDEGVDLATMLDDDGSDVAEDSEDEEDTNEDQSSENDDEDSEGEDRHARLQDFVEGLGQGSKIKKSQTAQATNEDTLTLDDLLEDADLDSKTLATLKPKKKHAPELVTSALPKRQQDAIDRGLATKKAKEQLDRWRDTVVQNRRAEFLSFPLRNPDEGELPSTDTFAPTQQGQPATELESSIRQIMEESGMLTRSIGNGVVEEGEHGLLKAEELETNKLPVEEVLARRAELRRTRALLFREEIKAKRIAKIKSKAYRRVHRKERERLADKERMLMDPEGFANGDLNEDEQEEADRRRAEARMSAKHKDSKWAKSLRATDRAVWDDDARAGVIEQARRQEELKRRIAGRDVDHSDDSDDDEDDSVHGDHSTQLARMANANGSLHEPKGLAALKFMQTAEKRRQAQNNAAIAELQRDLDPAIGEDDSDIEDNGLGRAIFGPKPTATKVAKPVKQHELEEGHMSGDEDEMQASLDTASNLQDNKTSHEHVVKGRGPLASSRLGSTKDDKPASKSAWLTAPKEKKSKLDRKLARENDNEAIINTSINAAGESSQKASPSVVKDTVHEKSVGSTDGWTTVSYKQDADIDLETAHEADAEKPMLSKAERNAAFHARAFAGDDVALHFTDEKDALAASEDEKETSNHMPGWGAWAGAGLTKAARKAAERARHNPLYKTKVAGVRPQDRKDAKLENVIISEKNDRKGKKYLAPILPHQYERKEEYERSLRMPIGPEWSTKEVFQHNTRPRVVVKPGTIIEPMSKPLI